MANEIFYEYESTQYGDGIVLNEYRNEFSLVAAKRKDGEIYMEWVFPQKRDGSKQPIDKSLPWKIKLGRRDEAIKVLRFFLKKLENETPLAVKPTKPNDTRYDDVPPPDDEIPF